MRTELVKRYKEKNYKWLSNFLFKISSCKPDWTAGHFISQAISAIQNKVGEDGKVITGISGGVDSSVTAALLDKAIGDQLVCVFVDHGLLRGGEAEEISSIFKKRLGSRFINVKAEKVFISIVPQYSALETSIALRRREHTNMIPVVRRAIHQ